MWQLATLIAKWLLGDPFKATFIANCLKNALYFQILREELQRKVFYSYEVVNRWYDFKANQSKWAKLAANYPGGTVSYLFK